MLYFITTLSEWLKNTEAEIAECIGAQGAWLQLEYAEQHLVLKGYTKDLFKANGVKSNWSKPHAPSVVIFGHAYVPQTEEKKITKQEIKIYCRMRGDVQEWRASIDGKDCNFIAESEEVAWVLALGYKYLGNNDYRFFGKYVLRMLGIQSGWAE